MEIKSKNYIKFSISFILILLTTSFVLNRLDFNITDNDLIKKFQFQKISDEKFKKIDTIIVGDSSGGNSIDSKYLSEISNLNVSSLSLTGSWGIVGSLGMIKKALESNPEIKNIIVVQTIDIWSRGFSKQSVLELYSTKEITELLSLKDLISYAFNIKELWWHLRYIANKDFAVRKEIDYNHDYLKQKTKKFSNNRLKVDATKTFNSVAISKQKLEELILLDKFCSKKKLNCIFLNGPIHSSVAKNSKAFFTSLNTKIKDNLYHIKYFSKIFSYENYKMGDTIDHIDVNYKKESTQNYYKLIKDDLVY